MNAISPNLSRAALRIRINPQAPKAATVRIIAEPLPWPDLKTQPNRSSMRLRWRCFTEEGVLLVSETTHPFADGAAALLLNGHATPDAKVTLRHVGKAYDSFGPMKLEVIALQGIRRTLGRDRLKRLARRRDARRKAQREAEAAMVAAATETNLNNNLSDGE
jgi:hypothetical protein